MYYKFKVEIVDILVIFFGCLIVFLGVNFFLFYVKFLSGGVIGIGLFL